MGERQIFSVKCFSSVGVQHELRRQECEREDGFFGLSGHGRGGENCQVSPCIYANVLSITAQAHIEGRQGMLSAGCWE